MVFKRQNMVVRVIPEPDLLLGALHPVGRFLALVPVLPWKFRQVCSINMLFFGECATININFSFPGAASDGPYWSEAGDVSTEAEVRRSRGQRQAVIRRRFVPLSGQDQDLLDSGSHERSRNMLEQAFDDGMVKLK